jgi:hypothetical protein
MAPCMRNLNCLAVLAVMVPACANNPNDIMVQLSPDVISSIDGTMTVHALVLDNRDPIGKGKAIDLAVDYTDRNGMAHTIAPASGTTDDRGAFDTKFEGLIWDGIGTVTATVGAVTGEASFSVLDRTPPKVTIVAPSAIHINNNATFQVHVTDEIGVSEVFFEANQGGNGGNGNRQRSTVIASGSTDAMVSFDYQANDTQVGQMVTFYALASDLSSNQSAAQPVTVTIQQ